MPLLWFPWLSNKQSECNYGEHKRPFRAPSGGSRIPSTSCFCGFGLHPRSGVRRMPAGAFALRLPSCFSLSKENTQAWRRTRGLSSELASLLARSGQWRKGSAGFLGLRTPSPPGALGPQGRSRCWCHFSSRPPGRWAGPVHDRWQGCDGSEGQWWGHEKGCELTLTSRAACALLP
ncbi:hypothetical protein HJG60_009171 [Phyllostomus discolor]|uniref:Uncharacterized protein n=1 Tax=Phyllostomus discolor TaxID=89673 RepID=A0A834DF33_9CHIR|nr:hypothetical protein HJG60_009171 [Phyllostomus discolor]